MNIINSWYNNIKPYKLISLYRYLYQLNHLKKYLVELLLIELIPNSLTILIGDKDAARLAKLAKEPARPVIGLPAN